MYSSGDSGIITLFGAFSGLLFIGIIILLVLLIIAGTFFVVPQQRVYVIERLGKFNRMCHAGFHVRIPFVERIAAKLDLRTQQEVMSIDAKTSDNVTIGLQVAVQYHVDFQTAEGMYAACYALSDPISQMVSYITDSLRSSIPKYTLDEVFDKKDSIANDVREDVTATMAKYGYVVVSTLIQDIELPPDVKAAMNDINTAQRKKTAAQSLAEAEKIKLVTEATAKAEAAEQAGIGIANQRKAIAEGINKSITEIRESGLSEAEANLMFLFTQWTDMMTAFAENGNAATVVLPSDFNESASMFEHMLIANKAGDRADGAGVRPGRQ